MRAQILVLSILATLVWLNSCNQAQEQQANATPKVDVAATLVQNISSCSRLYTNECQIHKIVSFNDKKELECEIFSNKMSIGAGTRKVAIPMDVTVKAYIDFSEFNASKLKIDSNRVYVELPDPKIEITASNIDHTGIREYTTGLRQKFDEEEIQTYVQKGMDDIIAQLPGMGLVEHAKLSAVRLLNPIIAQLGYSDTDIHIGFKSGINDKALQKDSPIIKIEQTDR